MAYKPRSLTAISQSIRGAFRQYLPGTDAALKQNVLYVVAKVLALLSREFELRFAWVYRQVFLSTADDIEHVRMHTADYLIYQKPAAASAGAATGVGAATKTYPAGVRFLSAGTTFVTTAPFMSDGSGAFTAAVRAEATGAATNREPGAVLVLTDASMYPTLPGEVAVGPLGLGGGADIEDIESLRQRGLFRKSRPPQGGALPDYERFALDVPGVAKAWAYRFVNGVGTIAIYVLFDGRPNSIPTAGDLASVQAAIEERRMIRLDDAIVIAPIPAAVPIVIAGLSNDTLEIRAAIETNLRAVFLERGKPGLASDPFVLSRSWLSEAISIAIGEDRHILVAPGSDLTFTGGQIPVLGAVTYQ